MFKFIQLSRNWSKLCRIMLDHPVNFNVALRKLFTAWCYSLVLMMHKTLMNNVCSK